jgi:hypothetical protein
MKKLISGMFIGVFVSLLVFNFTSYAETSGNVVKLIVNGVTLQDELQPISLDGRIYVSARSLSEALGASVNWDSEQNAVIVNSIKVETTKPVDSPIINPVNPVVDTNKTDVNTTVTEPIQSGDTNQVKETTFNNYMAIEINGVTYIHSRYFDSSIYFNKEANSITITNNEEKTEIPINKENVQIYNGVSYINIKYCN